MRRGLLEDDSAWQRMLQEAAGYQTGQQLRQLFATLLLYCKPTEPHVLWHDNREALCEDLLHEAQRNVRSPLPERSFQQISLNMIFVILNYFIFLHRFRQDSLGSVSIMSQVSSTPACLISSECCRRGVTLSVTSPTCHQPKHLQQGAFPPCSENNWHTTQCGFKLRWTRTFPC